MGSFKKILTLFFVTLLVLTGCSSNEEASKKETKPKETVTAEKKETQPKDPEQELHDFVLEHTKIVHILTISKNINEQQPDLGPFDVITGIDRKGVETEVWIKDKKIHEIKTVNKQQ